MSSINSEANDSIKSGNHMFRLLDWSPFPFQLESWKHYDLGYSGIINAPTGSGKTYSLLIPMLREISGIRQPGIKAIWITPIRALAKEIELSANRAIELMQLKVRVGIRSGDTSGKERINQSKTPPDLIITTPESLHLLLGKRDHETLFKHTVTLVADEWHELIGTKRGVQLELAISRLKSINPNLKIWGISATIQNLGEAMEVLLGPDQDIGKRKLIRADLAKKIEVISILPDKPEKLPWAGHLGIRLIDKVIPILESSSSTLLFTNTRSFAEIWYQKLLERAPSLAGQIAMHHGSISSELRQWVEQELHEGKLKAVVCTSSLDLGVDFRPVDTVIQVGSPKGIARFLQRAGRSGHQPGATSKIYFLPTHSLELTEAAALREGIRQGIMEERIPHIRSFDVLIQYLLTLACGDGFESRSTYLEIRNTWSFQTVTDDEWNWVLNFITTGGEALHAYDEYRKVELVDGKIRMLNNTLARRHRLSIGTIVGDAALKVKYVTGKYLGSIEEYFLSGLNPGDVFWFAGRSLELIRIREMEAQVKNSKKKTGKVPSWQGGRMPLSSPLGALIREKFHSAAENIFTDPEMQFIIPLLGLQQKLSCLPRSGEFLVEYLEDDEGYHLLMYPFEGRFVHEGLAALVAHRISAMLPISFSIAMNDYGFELLSDQPIPVEDALAENILGAENLLKDIQASINSTEMARRKFREIAAIAGLVFKGFPGAPVRDRHLQSSAQLFFDVFMQYDNNNLLLQQSFEEVMDFQLEEARMRNALERIAGQKIILKRPERPTPLSFPVMVDRLREKLTTEQIMDRVAKMTIMYEDENI
jgi:ATP-dependent Lhr-like helicase